MQCRSASVTCHCVLFGSVTLCPVGACVCADAHARARVCMRVRARGRMGPLVLLPSSSLTPPLRLPPLRSPCSPLVTLCSLLLSALTLLLYSCPTPLLLLLYSSLPPLSLLPYSSFTLHHQTEEDVISLRRGKAVEGVFVVVGLERPLALEL